MLVYRGEAPDAAADPGIDALSGCLSFPIAYGYAAVGTVVAVGSSVDPDWIGTRVFSFQPHTSHFTAPVDRVVPLPSAVSFADGALIPSVETAVTLLMDARPMIGERVVVFGQGIIGLLVTQFLHSYPLSGLYTVEPVASRRRASESAGATKSFAPDAVGGELASRLDVTQSDAADAGDGPYEGADLVLETSGRPEALDAAVSIAGFDARIIVGSWYGTKTADLDLGGRFHRSRISIRSSQVSTLSPDVRGRWNTDRRLDTVLDLLEELEPGRLITDEYPPSEAPSLYRRLDQEGGALLQPVFRYD
jgi:threonine dehydrogenase-like Zn-dependent dehydrogenase